jgi:hypothetical protein
VDARGAGRSPLVLDDHGAGAAKANDWGDSATREEAMADFKARWGMV